MKKETFIVKLDGNKWCAHRDDFVNLIESNAGFGDTPGDACEALQAVESREEWPKKESKYWYITSKGYSAEDTNFGHGEMDKFKSFLGIFQTEELAQKKLAAVKAVFPIEKWVPEEGPKCPEYWAFDAERAFAYPWKNNTADCINFAIGNVHKTKKLAEAWGKAVLGEDV